MYELLTGEHPIGYKGMTKEEYKEELAKFDVEKLFERPHPEISELAQSLIVKLCQRKPSYWYNAHIALMHPWITRDFKASVPKTMIEEQQCYLEAEYSMRSAVQVAYSLSVIKLHKKVMRMVQEKRRWEEEQRIIQ